MKNLLLAFTVLLIGCGMSNEEKQRVAMVACAEMKETIQIQGLERVRTMNAVREKIGGEPYLKGDDEIKRSIEWDTCTLLALDAPEYEVTTNNNEESYRLAQKEIAEEMARKREAELEEMARKREAEFQEKKSDLRVEAGKLEIAFVVKGFEVAVADIGGNLSDEVIGKSYAKVFTDKGLSKEEATKVSLVAYLRQEVDSAKDDNNLNRYAECVDKIIPSSDDIFFAVAAREYKPLSYSSLLTLSWDDCDAI